MSRIIIPLAVVALLMLSATMVIGLSLGDYQATVREYRDVASRISEAEERFSPDHYEQLPRLKARLVELDGEMNLANWHRLLGVGSAILSLLVNCVVVTYFIGTARWCREVSEAYQLDMSLAAASARLKRQAFPWAVASAAAIIVTVALGGTADPVATGRLDSSANWATAHLIVAMTTIAVVAVSLCVQWMKVGENARVIAGVMDAVRARGGEQAGER